MANKDRLEKLEARLGGGEEPTTPSHDVVVLLDAAAEHKARGGSLEDVPGLKATLDVLREKDRRGWR